MVGRQTAPYSPELEPDFVLTQPRTLPAWMRLAHPLVIGEGGSIPLHWNGSITLAAAPLRWIGVLKPGGKRKTVELKLDTNELGFWSPQSQVVDCAQV
jgi:hypothetical protein